MPKADDALAIARRRYSLADIGSAADGPLLKVGQIAAILGLSMDTTREMADAGDIRCVWIGRDRRIAWRSFRAYLFRTHVLPLTDEELAQPLGRADRERDLQRQVHELTGRVNQLTVRVRRIERKNGIETEDVSPTITASACSG